MATKDKEMGRFVSSFCGTASGAISSTIFHPLSVVQTRLQVTPKHGKSVLNYQYHSIRNAFTTILQTEGIGALYQGLSPSLLGNAAAWGIYFGVYNEARKFLSIRNGEDASRASTNKLGPLDNLKCSCIAGWFTSLCTNPIWVIKTRMHIQTYNQPGNYHGLADAFRTLWKEEGVRGLYRGILPSFFGVSHGAIQFVIFEELNKMVRVWNNEEKVGFYESLATGAISKVCAAVTTYPYLVVKSRLQMRPLVAGDPPPYVGVANTIKILVRKEGLPGFYRGCAVNLMRVTPSSALTLGIYTFLSNTLNK